MIPVLELFIDCIIGLEYGANDRFYWKTDVMEDNKNNLGQEREDKIQDKKYPLWDVIQKPLQSLQRKKKNFSCSSF